MYIRKLIDRLFLLTVGPLLLSVKGIIDLAQMPPTILLPHPGGTGAPTLERIAYLPGAQPPFPSRAFNPTSISPGEDPSLPYPHLFRYLPATFSAFTHTCMSAALHWPEVSKISSTCPVTGRVLIILQGFLSRMLDCPTSVVFFLFYLCSSIRHL